MRNLDKYGYQKRSLQNYFNQMELIILTSMDSSKNNLHNKKEKYNTAIIHVFDLMYDECVLVF